MRHERRHLVGDGSAAAHFLIQDMTALQVQVVNCRVPLHLLFGLIGRPFVVKCCVRPALRTGRGVPAALPVPGG